MDKGNIYYNENNQKSTLKCIGYTTKVLCYIFNYVSSNEFYRLATYKYIKEDWDILNVTHKGTFLFIFIFIVLS